MSNKIDQLFKRTLEKEHFEYKASYFEALEGQGLPMRRSFFWRNRQFLLLAIPLLFVGSASMAYYFVQNSSSSELETAEHTTSLPYDANPNTVKLGDNNDKQLAFHTTSSSIAPRISGVSPTGSQDQIELEATQIRNTESKHIPVANERGGNRAMVGNTPQDETYKDSEVLEGKQGMMHPSGYDVTANTRRAAKEQQGVEALFTSGNKTDLAHRNLQESFSNDQLIQSHEPAKGDASWEETANISSHSSIVSSLERTSANNHTAGNGLLSSFGKSSISTATDANATGGRAFKNGLTLDSFDVCLLDGVSSSELRDAESNLAMVHPKGRRNSSLFLGLSTQYNYFSKDPITEGPYKKYMRMRIAGESPTNNFSHGIYAKRVGQVLSYSAGLNMGVLSEDIGYIGQSNVYNVKVSYESLGDTLNASPGSPRPTLLSVRKVVDSVLIGKKDTVFQKRSNRINYVELPLSIGYRHQLGRVSAELQGGVNLMYAYKMEGYYLHDSREYMNPIGEHFSRFSMSPTVGLELNYQLNTHWMIGSKFTYKMPNARFSPDSYFAWKQSTLGLNLSYRIR